MNYQLTDKEREVLKHRDPVIHEGYILKTEYDLALDHTQTTDRRPYAERLRDLLEDSKVFRNIVNRVLLLLLGYKGEFLDFTNPGAKLNTGRIVCLGWGSLIWDPRNLALRTTDKPWHRDGPALPIDFTRESLGGKITLVITKEAPLVPVLRADVNFETVDEACANLSEREWSGSDPQIVVGVYDESVAKTPGESNPADPSYDSISRWAREKGFRAVIWTKLPPKFKGEDGRIPSADEVLAHFGSVPNAKKAREYVRKTPARIATPYRKIIEASLGWTTTAAPRIHKSDRLVSRDRDRLMTGHEQPDTPGLPKDVAAGKDPLYPGLFCIHESSFASEIRTRSSVVSTLSVSH